ncbi:MAG: exo-alpha-sialidase [Planctomycetes bacterium]|nr:exo-alpha-sialidase [Planctomycetota bacterium]NOG54193.1 exo-alpha-sialidase [Planctomycetota bacterium]
MSTRIVSTAAAAAVAAMSLSGHVLAQPVDNGVQINTDNAGNNIVGDAANEPSFAVSTIDPDVLVVGWRQFPTISSDVRYGGYGLSWDGGRTWTYGGDLDPPPGAGPNANQSDPVLAVDDAGSFFYNSLVFRSSKDGQTVYRSDDDGVTWQTPNYIEFGFLDKNWYNIDTTGVSRNHYCIWGNSTIFFKRSTDEGVTWPSPLSLGQGISSYVSIAPDGTVYTGWWEYWTDTVKVRRSDNAWDGSRTPTFNSARSLDFGAWPYQFPLNPDGGAGQFYIEADPSGGARADWVYALSSGIPANDACEVFFSRSTDRGDSWSTPITINDDSDPNDYQWMAVMSVSPGGRIDAAWLDTRDDPNHTWSRLYYSYSYDGGITWAPNRALSDAFDPLVGWPQQRKIGDYFQSQSDTGGVGIVYPATFNGEQDLYFRRAHPILLDADQMFGGQNVEIRITGAKPNQNAFLAYSLRGEGRTHVSFLDVDVELKSPIQAGSSVMTDANGDASWTLGVPNAATGRTVWLQSVQQQNASNVVKQTVQ